MRILHYFLGFNRAGGLNRYAADLAATQVRCGHQVFALYPAGSFRKKAAIFADGTERGVVKYKFVGGRPVPLLLGVGDPERMIDFPRKIAAESVRDFCDLVHPDIVHVHTWMGFPDELLTEFKKRHVGIVFTTHDYYGFCPKVNLIDCDGRICEEPDNARCSRCNMDAPSERELALRNSHALLLFKRALRPFANFLRRGRSRSASELICRDYAALKAYYVGLWKQCDLIHCNSEVSGEIYRKFLPEARFETIPISHSGIVDRRARKSVGATIEFSFSGPGGAFKGLPQLLAVLTDMYRDGIRNWRLNVWGHDGSSTCPAIVYRGRYTAKKNAEVFQKSDLLIVPSMCHETFGFIVPEALMYGTPVLCSDTVGAKMLVAPEMVYSVKEELRKKLEFFCRNPHDLERINGDICAAEFVMDMTTHTRKITDMYRNIGR